MNNETDIPWFTFEQQKIRSLFIRQKTEKGADLVFASCSNPPYSQ